jgi:hypothetical protein
VDALQLTAWIGIRDIGKPLPRETVIGSAGSLEPQRLSDQHAYLRSQFHAKNPLLRLVGIDSVAVVRGTNRAGRIRRKEPDRHSPPAGHISASQ